MCGNLEVSSSWWGIREGCCLAVTIGADSSCAEGSFAGRSGLRCGDFVKVSMKIYSKTSFKRELACLGKS